MLNMRDLNETPVKTLFLGTEWESETILYELDHNSKFEIVGVVTPVDKPVGRKQTLTPTKVKEYALSRNIDVYHTEGKKEKYQQALEKFKPELVVCIAFGEILPDFFIQYPKYKAVNIHFSLLPKYRGAVPIQKAILEGEEKTGISFMLMSAGMDEGDILKRLEIPILLDDTNLSLRKKLVKISESNISQVLEDWINGKTIPTKQDNSKATYCWKEEISKKEAEIKWSVMEPTYIERLIRAMIPWPNAWCFWREKRVQILSASLLTVNSRYTPGTLFVDDGRLLFATKEKNCCLMVNELVLEGKAKMLSKEFINGVGKELPN